MPRPTATLTARATVVVCLAVAACGKTSGGAAEPGPAADVPPGSADGGAPLPAVEPWRVGWQSRSARGGSVFLELAGDAAGAVLRITVDTPRVALEADRLDTPAFGGAPREIVSALVPFAFQYATFRGAILGVLGG